MDSRTNTIDVASIDATAVSYKSQQSEEDLPLGPRSFFDKTLAGAAARRAYLKLYGSGLFAVILLIFAVFSIFWGSLWKSPAHSLHGMVVDFDGGFIGQNVTQALIASQAQGKITWEIVPASNYPSGPQEFMEAIRNEKAWAGISINPRSTERLMAALANADPSYNGALAITAYGVEARNENGYRNIIRPTIQTSLGAITATISARIATSLAGSTSLSSILTTSPQTITMPVTYTLDNIIPFDQPVATAVTFVGMLYQIVLGVFVVMISLEARQVSGLARTLSTRNLIWLRLASSFFAYFIISFFYSLLNLAFSLDVTRKFGHSGFLVFWMVNFVGASACSLILEALITLLTQKGLPFFMLTWMIINLSVATLPLDALPHVFHYGWGVPFFNLSRALRTIVFGTRNEMGEAVGVLLAWVAFSCLLLSLIQWRARRAEGVKRAEDASVQSHAEKHIQEEV